MLDYKEPTESTSFNGKRFFDNKKDAVSFVEEKSKLAGSRTGGVRTRIIATRPDVFEVYYAVDVTWT